MKGTLARLLARHHDALRRALVTRHALRAFGLAALALALAVLADVLRPSGPAFATVRLWSFVAASLAATIGAAGAVRRASPGFDRFLENVETSFPDVRSWLRNAMDVERAAPAHTSAELAGALSSETARRLSSIPLESLRPRIEPARPLAFAGIALAALVIATFAAPARTERAWHSLWNPSLAAPPVRLAVEPGAVTLTPGASLAVRARVWGSASTPRLLRDGSPGISPASEGLGRDGERVWRFDLGSLTREQLYRVRVASTESPRYRISLAGEPRALSFDIETSAPAYARMPAQRTSATRGDLSALRGSRARVEITFDRDLETLAATLPGGAAAQTERVTPRRWRVSVPIEREGQWRLDAVAASGRSRLGWNVRPLADAPPLLAVRTPEGDMDLPQGQHVPVEVLAQDDLGLSTLDLEMKKGEGEWRRAGLANFPGAPRDAQVSTAWDASALGLLPGESAAFRFVLYDNNAFGRGRAVSPSFLLRFPSLAELYETLDREHSDVQNNLTALTEKARELQKSLDRLQRQSVPSRPQSPQASSHERREEFKTSLDRQQEISQRLDSAAKELQESLQRASERRAYDQELLRKVEEVSKLLKEIESPELKRALEKMRQALERMDQQTMDRNLQQWREENRDLLKNLERTLQLLKELRNEEKLASLAQRAEELEKRQNALNEQHGERAERKERPESDPSARDPEAQSKEAQERSSKEAQQRAEQQREAADQSKALAEEAHALSEQMENPSERSALDEASQTLDQEASEQQKQAAEDAQKQQNRSAQQQGQKASESLRKARQGLQQMAQQRAQKREGANLAAVRRAAQDLVSLQRSASENMSSGTPSPQRADRQMDLAEGTSRVADSLFQLAAKTPFISPQLGEALGKAVQNLDRSGRALSEGQRAQAEDAARQGADALNRAVLELRDTESSMCSQPGNGSDGQTPSIQSQMGQVGERQSQLNQQTRRVAQRLSEQSQGLTPGDREELQRLSEEQRAIRERLQNLQQRDESERKLLGRLDQAQREMQAAEEALRDGDAGSDLEETQSRILSRLLDAQRSVNRRDYNPDRESRSGEDVARSSPSELPAELFRTSDRLRLDLLKAEADRYPAQYRALVERYLRSLNGNRR